MNDQIFVKNEQSVNVVAENMLTAADLWAEQREILQELAREQIAMNSGLRIYIECGWDVDEALQMEREQLNHTIQVAQARLRELENIY